MEVRRIGRVYGRALLGILRAEVADKLEVHRIAHVQLGVGESCVVFALICLTLAPKGCSSSSSHQ